MGGKKDKLLCEFSIKPLEFKVFGYTYGYVFKTYRFDKEKNVWMKYEQSYFTRLEDVFRDVMEIVMKERMSISKNKTLEEMTSIIQKTRNDVVKTFERFKNVI